MSKLTKVAQKIFGLTAGASQIAQFGSLAAGSPAFTTDPATAMSLSNWLNGWFSAVIGGNAPAIEDMNAAFFAITYQLGYVMQAGVPEWDATTIYYIGSFVNIAGVIYVSRTDGNVNHDPTADTTNWKVIGGDLMTALGDIVYGGAAGKAVKLAGNTDAVRKMLTQTGDGVGGSAAPVWNEVKAPTLQKFLSGTGTYNLPAGCIAIEIEAVGAGGGGGGSGAGSAAGTNGGNTTFGTSLIAANGGTGGGAGNGSFGTSGVGGSASLGAAEGRAVSGANGGSGIGSSITTVAILGGAGGSSVLGGAGSPTLNGANAAAANSGSGGAGGSGSSSGSAINTGGGGGAGGFVKGRITNPAASYSYAVGAKGTGGAAGTGGFAGADAGAGSLLITEYYQ